MGGQARVLAYRQRIHCKKIFAVPGNHDKQARKLKEEFSWLDNLAEVWIHCQLIVLCHSLGPECSGRIRLGRECRWVILSHRNTTSYGSQFPVPPGGGVFP